MREVMIPAEDYSAIIRPEIDRLGGLSEFARAVARGGGGSEDAVLRRTYEVLKGRQETISLRLADRTLTAIGRQDALDELLGPPETDLHYERVGFCEDCGGKIEEGVWPIDLMRPDPLAMEGRIWDSTKRRWVRRPRNAAAGGRRFRLWSLCRLCRANALRGRAGTATSENGKKRYIRTHERVPPKRGGRPRLLSDSELRAAYTIYAREKLSIGELADRLSETREQGTRTGYYQSLLYGWRRLKLPLRDRGQQIAYSRHGTDGTKSKHWKQRCSARVRWGERKGKRCRLFVRIIRTETGSHPAEDGLCWDHAKRGET